MEEEEEEEAEAEEEEEEEEENEEDDDDEDEEEEEEEIIIIINGRLYAQLDQPRKVRFEINAVEVYDMTHDIHILYQWKILTFSDTSGFEPRCFKLTVVQLCINENEQFDLCTTGPTHMYCKLNKYKYMWQIYNIIHITLSTYSIDLF